MNNIEIEITKNPKIKPKNGRDIGFGNIYTDHMFIMTYNDKDGWHDAKIVPYKNIELDPCAMCFHYGQTVFEGLKAYKSKNGKILLFRPDENFKRLNRSCERLCIPEVDENLCLEGLKKLIEVDREWIPDDEESSLYIRPFIIATQPNLGVKPSSSYYYIVVMSPSGAYYKTGMQPVDIYVETNYVRAAKGGMGMAKTGGNYAVSLKSQTEAHEKGYAQTLWLDAVDRKYIEEVGAMNIFFVLDDEIVTPAINGSILEGITRKSVIDILKHYGYKVRERRVSIDEICDAYDMGKLKEMFGTGTAAVISPIGSLKYNDKDVVLDREKSGSISEFLYKTLTGIQRGQKNIFNDWIVEIK